MQLKRTTFILLVCFATGAGAQDIPTLSTPKDKLSYSVGVQTAKTFKKEGVDIDVQLFLDGLKDGLGNGKLLLPDVEMRQLMRSFAAEVRQKMVLNQRALVLQNKTKGEEFLAANKTKDGVTVLPNGVQYRILKVGDGRKPSDDDLIEFAFRATLIDGTEFDGSDPGKTVMAKVSSLIMGWRETVKLMPVGSKWQIFIPPQLAYGERGAGSDIGPNETVIFEMGLVGIK